MYILVVALMIGLFVVPAVPVDVVAQPMGRGMSRGAPYGDYCPGPRWGPYGARQPVRTVEEARQAMERYLSGTKEDGRVGKIEEKRSFFQVEIVDRDGAVIDTAIVHKRTGRIRTIY
jgi:hypothetical protein